MSRGAQGTTAPSSGVPLEFPSQMAEDANGSGGTSRPTGKEEWRGTLNSASQMWPVSFRDEDEGVRREASPLRGLGGHLPLQRPRFSASDLPDPSQTYLAPSPDSLGLAQDKRLPLILGRFSWPRDTENTLLFFRKLAKWPQASPVRWEPARGGGGWGGDGCGRRAPPLPVLGTWWAGSSGEYAPHPQLLLGPIKSLSSVLIQLGIKTSALHSQSCFSVQFNISVGNSGLTPTRYN